MFKTPSILESCHLNFNIYRDIAFLRKKILSWGRVIALGILFLTASSVVYARTSDVSWSPSLSQQKIDGFVAEKVKVSSVFDKIGLKPGDKLLEINGEPVKGIVQLMMLTNGLRNNEQFDLKLVRNGKTIEMKARL